MIRWFCKMWRGGKDYCTVTGGRGEVSIFVLVVTLLESMVRRNVIIWRNLRGSSSRLREVVGLSLTSVLGKIVDSLCWAA